MLCGLVILALWLLLVCNIMGSGSSSLASDPNEHGIAVSGFAKMLWVLMLHEALGTPNEGLGGAGFGGVREVWGLLVDVGV